MNTRKYRFTPLSSDEQSLDVTEKALSVGQRRGRSAWSVASYILCIVIAFVFGRQSSNFFGSSYDSVVPLNTIERTFLYNDTFGGKPSKETNKAWKDIFPIQGGFFKHPDIAPERSAFAVYHTLHCVDALRHGYYVLHDALSTGKSLNMSDLPFHASPRHFRHCIDLLRQNIMCQPDLTIEVVDEKAGGVTGFGTAHQCKDWQQLNDWMAVWEGWQHTPKHSHNGDEEMEDEHEHEHVHDHH